MRAEGKMQMQMHKQRRVVSILAVGAVGVFLTLIALISVMSFAADVPDAAAFDNANSKGSQDLPEGLDATRRAQPPPPTAKPGILGAYYPFFPLNPTAITFASPTPPPVSGTQIDVDHDRG